MNDTLKYILVIVVVVALGILAVNQIFGWYYKIQFLKTPCDLCTELNPQFETCFKTITAEYTGSPLYNNTLNFSIEDYPLPF